MALQYVMDSDILIHLQRGNPLVCEKFAAIPSAQFCTTIISHAEVHVGVYRREDNRRVRAFYERLFARLPVLPFDEKAAHEFARIKAMLLLEGRKMHDMDIAIAAIAMTHRLTLVTNNARDFHRVPGLKLQSWN